jgi:hypothetical protein
MSRYGSAAVDVAKAGAHAILPPSVVRTAGAGLDILKTLNPLEWNNPLTVEGREGRAAAKIRAFNELPLAQQMDRLPPTPAPETTRFAIEANPELRAQAEAAAQRPAAGRLRTAKAPKVPPTPAEQMGLSPTSTGATMETYPETPVPEGARAPMPVDLERAPVVPFNERPLHEQMADLPETPAPERTRFLEPPLRQETPFHERPLHEQMRDLPETPAPERGRGPEPPQREAAPPPVPFNELPLAQQMEQLPTEGVNPERMRGYSTEPPPRPSILKTKKTGATATAEPEGQIVHDAEGNAYELGQNKQGAATGTPVEAAPAAAPEAPPAAPKKDYIDVGHGVSQMPGPRGTTDYVGPGGHTSVTEDLTQGGKRYAATLHLPNGENHSLGYVNTAEEAHQAAATRATDWSPGKDLPQFESLTPSAEKSADQALRDEKGARHVARQKRRAGEDVSTEDVRDDTVTRMDEQPSKISVLSKDATQRIAQTGGAIVDEIKAGKAPIQKLIDYIEKSKNHPKYAEIKLMAETLLHNAGIKSPWAVAGAAGGGAALRQALVDELKPKEQEQ